MLCNNIGVNEAGRLTFAGMDTVDLAKKYKTPLYLMDEDKIRANCRILLSAAAESHFSCSPFAKITQNLAIVRSNP